MTGTDTNATAQAPQALAANAALVKRLEEARGYNQGLRDQISKLLAMIDDMPGNESLHYNGSTPDFYVEAAFWSCYGYAPDDARAFLAPFTGAKP